MAETILFWIFAVAAVLSALAVVFPPFPRARDPIHSAIALVACFFFVAATYALLSAHLLAVLQVLVYAGAIMVLFIFVIMLLNLQQDESRELPKIGLFKVVSALAVLSTGAALVLAFVGEDLLAPIQGQLVAEVPAPETYGTLESVGKLLFNKYLLPFELTSVLLLVAIVGSVIIAKRDPRSTFVPEAVRARTARERHGKRLPPRPGERPAPVGEEVVN